MHEIRIHRIDKFTGLQGKIQIVFYYNDTYRRNTRAKSIEGCSFSRYESAKDKEYWIVDIPQGIEHLLSQFPVGVDDQVKCALISFLMSGG